MAPEEQTQKCSYSSSGTGGGGGGARSCKKQKGKRVPQRGLGVAQLERIRLEEQQKRDGGSTVSPSPTKSSKFDHISSQNFIFRPSSSSSSSSSSLQINDILNSINSTTTTSIVPLTKNHPVGKLWNSCDYYNSSLEKGNISGLDPGIWPYESIPIWPLPGLMHRAAHQLVNVSSSAETPSSSSSVQKFQMEPPSNQSYYGDYTPMWPEDEKMVGMKRAYPFSLENHPPSFSPLHCKFPPPTVLPLISRSDDSTSCSGGHTLNSDPTYPISREGSNYSKINIKENGVLINGGCSGFLSLAPPPTATPKCQTSKSRHSPPSLAFTNSEFQGRVEDQVLFQPGPGGSNHQQQLQYYSFFPQGMARTGHQATGTVSNFNVGEVGQDQSVDLNLKL